MVSAWHRPSDVVTATLVAGAWALALAPVEHRQRHSTTAGRVMGVAALACLVLALAATAGEQRHGVRAPLVRRHLDADALG